MKSDEYFLKEAIKEAKKAYDKEEVPVGCVIVVDGKIISRGYNLKITNNCATSHAEIIAINKACKKLKTWILDNATIYVTLEPCIMCLGAIINARIKRLVYSAKEPKFGCVESLGNVFDDYKFNHHVEVSSGLFQDEVSLMMKTFFKELRNKKDNNS